MHYILLFVALVSCNRVQKRHEKQVRNYYKKVGHISRYKNQRQFSFTVGNPRSAPEYPFSTTNRYGLRKITKELFRCKGSGASKLTENGWLFDCNAIHTHSLPVQDTREFIYQEFLDLLNALQDKTGKRVLVHEGHRCPKHNHYLDSSYKNSFSKHQIAARVTFSLQGYSLPETIDVIREYYTSCNNPLYIKAEGIWSNKYIRVYAMQPIALELMFDRDSQKRVEYSYRQAHKSLYYY
jgi:hypothetical protein